MSSRIFSTVSGLDQFNDSLSVSFNVRHCQTGLGGTISNGNVSGHKLRHSSQPRRLGVRVAGRSTQPNLLDQVKMSTA